VERRVKIWGASIRIFTVIYLELIPPRNIKNTLDYLLLLDIAPSIYEGFMSEIEGKSED